jgi:site-specific recombinase XerD
VRVLYGSGARISEVLSLKWQDVQPRQNGTGAVLRIRDGKGGKARQAGINAAAYAALVALRREDTQPADLCLALAMGQP